MSTRIVILGAGFGGLELSTMLSEALGDTVEVTLIDKGDSFVFGFSKLDVMFSRATPDAVRLPYSKIAKPGVRVVRETITAIDPEARRVTTDTGIHEADILVIALGADYDMNATPGLAEVGSEFYSVAGAERLAGVISEFSEGHVIIGVCGAPFKCPPAPSECALLLHEELTRRGVRDACRISFVMPLGKPVPPSPETSAALEAEFASRDIELLCGRRIQSLDPDRNVTVLDDGSEIAFDLFLGVPKHRAPDVVIASGMTEDGYIPVDSATLKTRFPEVYAQRLIAELRGEESSVRHLGRGTCYIEFGEGRIGSVDIDFLSGAEKTGTFNAPSAEQMALKKRFGSSRRERWFGL
jgi:sulfide:quinone oxidoreductase